MSNWILAIIAVVAYLAVGRTVFWGLTKADWPKTQTWACETSGCSDSYRNRHYSTCERGRNLRVSRDRRVGLTYFWPVMLPVTIFLGLLVGTAVVTHAVMTEPITTPAERTARRLALEAEVRSAEAELEKTREVTPAKLTPPPHAEPIPYRPAHVTPEEWDAYQRRIARGYH